MQAVNNISVIAMSNSSKPIKFPHFQKLANQAMLHRAHVNEMAKTSTVAHMKARSSLVARCREKRVNWENNKKRW